MNAPLSFGLSALAAAGGLCFALAGCSQTPPPVSVDAPQLAAALRWVGTCAVVCSALGAVALIIASRKRK